MKSPKTVRYSKLGIALEVNCLDDLETAIWSCMNDSAVSTRLQQGLRSFRNREHAAKNIKDVIIQMINQ